MEAYETLGILGEGTYGVVVKARSRITGKLVAIKRFKQTEQDDHVRKTSAREVRMLQLLRHPNVIRLEDVFRKDGKLYLVFEFIDRTILQLLETTTRGLSHRELRRYTYQMLRGIEFCHKNSVIHRDIKPENVLIDDSGLLKLCDFGFARQMSSKAKYTDYVATRWYRAPELLVGDVAYGKPVDVWALGCMFAELSDGQPLFPGDSDLDQLCLILQTCGPIPARMVSIFEHNPLYSGISFPRTGMLYTLKDRYNRNTSDWLEFLTACLQPDPARRLTCTQLMALPYFTRDGFRDRYEAELRAATGLPQLRTAPTEATASPTPKRGNDQAASPSSLKAEPTTSTLSCGVSLPASPQQPGIPLQQHPCSNNTSVSPNHSLPGPKVVLEAAVLEPHGLRARLSITHTSSTSLPHAPTEEPIQLPMIQGGGTEKALVGALAEHHPNASQLCHAGTSSLAGGPPVGTTRALGEVEGTFSSALTESPSQELRTPILSTFSPSVATIDNKGKRVSLDDGGTLSDSHAHVHHKGGMPFANAAAAGGGPAGESSSQSIPIPCQRSASCTLPPPFCHGRDTDNDAGPSLQTYDMPSGESMMSSVAAIPEDGNKLSIPKAAPHPWNILEVVVNEDSRHATPSILTDADLLKQPQAPPTLAASVTAPLSERLPNLSNPLLHFACGGDKALPVFQPSALSGGASSEAYISPSKETSMVSTLRGTSRNPLAAVPVDPVATPSGKKFSDGAPAGMSHARSKLSISTGSAIVHSSQVSTEAKKRKLMKRKKDTNRSQQRIAKFEEHGASFCPAPGRLSEEETFASRSGFTGGLSISATSPSLSSLQEQHSHLELAEPVRSLATDQHFRESAGSSVVNGAHQRNGKVRVQLLRKERRSKPLAGSTFPWQEGEQRKFPQQALQPLPEALQPQEGGSSRRATATLLALSALRNITGPVPPSKPNADASKINNLHVLRSRANNGGEAVAGTGGSVNRNASNGGGVKPKAAGGRPNRTGGAYTLQSGSSGVETDTEALNRALDKRSPPQPPSTQLRQNTNGDGATITERAVPTPSQRAAGSTLATPYQPFTKLTRSDQDDAGSAQSRNSVRRLKQKQSDARLNGGQVLGKFDSNTVTLTTARQQQEGGTGTSLIFSAATAAAPYL